MQKTISKFNLLLLRGVETDSPFPKNTYKLKTFTCLMDKVPECVETVLEYDFQYWDELENYFSKNDGKIIDYRRTEWDPEPPEIRTEVNKHRFMLTCKGPVFTVGDLILTKDYELHRVVKVNY